MITITVDELADILQVGRQLLRQTYIRHFSLTRFVRTIKDRKGHCKLGFQLTTDSINALEEYLFKKKRCIDGIDELKEYYENMVKAENGEVVG